MAYTRKGIDRSAAMNRTSAFPLDELSYFESKAAADAAAATAKDAGDTTTAYYFGQIVQVVVNGAATIYKIEKDTTVTPNVGKLVSLEQAGEVGEDVLRRAKSYTDKSITGGEDLDGQIHTGLNVTDTAVAKKFVTAVSETSGLVSITRRELESADLPNVPVTKLELGPNGEKISADLLPGYVDDIVQFDMTTTPPSTPAEGDVYFNPTTKKMYACKVAGSWTEVTPEKTKIYVEKTSGKAYRWSGSDLVVIASNLALGETSTTAFRGDHGKIAYDHSQDANRVRSAVASGLYRIAVTAEGHVASTAAVEASDIPVTTYQFAGGTNKFTVTKPDGTTEDVTVTPSIANATQAADGLMSKEDKSKLDGVSAGANKVEASTTNGKIKIDGTETTVYTHPAYTSAEPSPKKVGLDATGHVVLGTKLTKSDVDLGNVNDTNITVSATDGVIDHTNNVTYKYNHPTTEAVAPAAVRVGKDSNGHVDLGSALVKSDVGLGLVDNQKITVTTTSVSSNDGTNTVTFDKYVHPAGKQGAQDAVAVKVGCDGTGHVIIGDALTKSDVGLDKVANTTITVTQTSVSSNDGTTTTTFQKYTHPDGAQTAISKADAVAVKVGCDGTGHVIIGSALTGADVGVTATTHSVTVNGTTFEHDYNLDPVTAAAVKVGKNAKGHVVLGTALNAGDVGITVTQTSVSDGTTTFNKYVHPDAPKQPGTGGTAAAAVKVGKDSTGHVVLGNALAVADISGLQTALDAKQDNLTFTGTYNASTNKVVVQDYISLSSSGIGNVVGSVTYSNGAFSVTKKAVAEADLTNELATKINNATSALHFIGVVAQIDIANGKYKMTTSPEEEWTSAKSGDVVLYGQKEYVCYTDQSVTPAKNKFAELGDESIYLTKTEAASTYVAKSELPSESGNWHKHDNKSTLDAITSTVKAGYDNAVTRLTRIAEGATKVVKGTNNGDINVTKRVNDAESTDTITVYDDSALDARVSANEAAITSLASDKASKVVVNTSDANAAFLKVNVNSEGIVAGTNAVGKSDLDNLIGEATTSQNGLMTTTQVTKLNGIEAGAQVNTIIGAKNKAGTAFTVTDKYIIIDDLVLDGGTSSSEVA